jgi:presenilin-like A22 family membrane protease
MFGISLEPFPVIVLLIALAFYDAIAVYKTKHMIDLADSVVKMNLPLLFVIPTKDDKPLMIGVGDVVIPNILTVSAQVFSKSAKIGLFKISALTTLIGAVIGLIALLTIAERFKKPHAGLPFLNCGAVIGYIVGEMLFC